MGICSAASEEAYSRKREKQLHVFNEIKKDNRGKKKRGNYTRGVFIAWIVVIHKVRQLKRKLYLPLFFFFPNFMFKWL